MAGAEKLGLGTASFGPDGAGNRTPPAEIAALLREAHAAGVRTIDTAPTYGEAEAAIGWGLPALHRFRIVTRAVAGDLDLVAWHARASLRSLRAPAAEALLAQSDDLAGAGGPELWRTLEALKGEGLYRRIGFSAALGTDPVALAKRYRPDLVQLPVSLLDQRLIAGGALDALAGMGVDVHLRSVLLQGLLFVPLEGMPGSLAGSAAHIARGRAALAEARVDPLTAAVRFALDRPEATCAVVGVDGMEQFRAVLAAASAATPNLDWSVFAANGAPDPLPQRRVA